MDITVRWSHNFGHIAYVSILLVNVACNIFVPHVYNSTHICCSLTWFLKHLLSWTVVFVWALNLKNEMQPLKVYQCFLCIKAGCSSPCMSLHCFIAFHSCFIAYHKRSERKSCKDSQELWFVPKLKPKSKVRSAIHTNHSATLSLFIPALIFSTFPLSWNRLH